MMLASGRFLCRLGHQTWGQRGLSLAAVRLADAKSGGTTAGGAAASSTKPKNRLEASSYTEIPIEEQHFPNQDQKTEAIMKDLDDHYENYTLNHPIWTQEETDSVRTTHRPPKGFTDKAAYHSVQTARKAFDLFSGYTLGKQMETLDEAAVIHRILFLETVAGIPGIMAAMIRHLRSLRTMERDHGWIHTLLEEAENERMHLMTFIQLKKPGILFRGSVFVTQYIFSVFFLLAYLVSPTFCHRFVGYLEEEAVITYTHILKDLDEGRLPMWKTCPAPDIAIKYWELGEDAMIKDVLLAIRADEAHHRMVNHTLASIRWRDKNPFRPKN